MKNRPEVIFENADLIVISKPAGLLSVPDRYDANKPNADRWLKARYDVAMPLHRLDRETSGILCFARNDDAFRHFSMAFQERDIRKYYTALVLGAPNPKKGTID